jgi:hypothetical protein
VEGSPEQPPRTNLSASGGRARWIVPLALVAALGGYGLYRWLSPGEPPPPLEQPAPPAAPEPAAPSTAAAAPEEPPATAAEAAALLERASPHPLFRKGLALPDLVRRWAVLTENLAQGDSPRKELSFLAPRGRFGVVRRGGALAASPEGWARYDEFAAAVASVDARAVASAYRRLHGVLETAYQALGYKPGALDAATARALRRVASAPLAAADAPLVQAEGIYVYADQKLEQLPEVEKHLLRMGPRNEGLVQAKARELLAALDLPAVATKR